MTLFSDKLKDVDIVYDNLRKQKSKTLKSIHNDLEQMWSSYEPYADEHFRSDFAYDPKSRFWEMYLTLILLKEGKNVLPRNELPKLNRDRRPDICIQENGTTIWIEATTPEPGDASNPDRVPEVIPINEGGGVQDVPRRQVELRITGALLEKKNAFQSYLESEIVSESDFRIIEISGAKFSIQALPSQFPRAVTAAYPIGDQYVTFDRENLEVTETGFHPSFTISRTNSSDIPRHSFLSPEFSQISGLIWSRISIGNGTSETPTDLTMIHNHAAEIKFPINWASWANEYDTLEKGEDIT